MITKQVTLYRIDEVSEEVKQKLVEKYWDINVDYDWWDSVYYDANQIGVEITSFDLYRHEIDGKLTEDLQTVCKNILAEHGVTCDTYQLAKKWQYKHGVDNEEEFKKELLHEYFKILQSNYDYLTSEEAIIETLAANDYHFNLLNLTIES